MFVMSGISIEERIDQVVARIIEIRKEKGLTMEYMAEELRISLPAYNKIEKKETKLSLERLFQIQEALDTTLSDLLSLKIENVYHQNLNDHSVGHQVVKNLYQDNRDIADKYINSLKEEITFLRSHVKIAD